MSKFEGINKYGRRDISALQRLVGQKITLIDFVPEDSSGVFYDVSVCFNGARIDLGDEGQSCCEHRYMTTDDELGYLVGARLVDIFTAEAPDGPHEYDVHEVEFLKIVTDMGTATFENHNEHNGYYGGFNIVARVRYDE